MAKSILQKREKNFEFIKGKIIISVDPSKKKNEVMVFSPKGIPVSRSFTVFNSVYGFKYLLRKVDIFSSKFNNPGIVFAIEPSGHYWKPLAYFLLNRRYDIVLVPGLLVSRSREIEDQTTSKTDPKDAYLVGDLTFNGKFCDANLPTGVYQEIRNYSRLWDKISVQRSSVRLKIRAILDVYFPEYHNFFYNILGASSLYILRRYPFPQDILNADTIILGREIARISRKKIDYKRIIQLKKAASESIGVTDGIDSARDALTILLEQIDLFTCQLIKISRKLKELIKETGYYKSVISLQGVGVISGSILLSEIGDFEDYRSYKQILKLAGLNLVLRDSGNFHGARRISKRGRALLRKVLFQIVVRAIRMNGPIRRKYLSLLLKGNHRVKAIVSTIPLFVRIMFSVLKDKRIYFKTEEFDDEIAYLEEKLNRSPKSKTRVRRTPELELVS